MPQYIFKHPKKNKTIEVVQGINEKHTYVDEKGVEWNRVFTVPQSSVDTKIDPLNPKDFVAKTGTKKGTLGNLYDKSKELSEQRKQLIGVDPVKKKYWEDYSKRRRGKKHPLSYED